jgi:hypothetical protein
MKNFKLIYVCAFLISLTACKKETASNPAPDCSNQANVQKITAQSDFDIITNPGVPATVSRGTAGSYTINVGFCTVYNGLSLYLGTGSSSTDVNGYGNPTYYNSQSALAAGFRKALNSCECGI